MSASTPLETLEQLTLPERFKAFRTGTLDLVAATEEVSVRIANSKLNAFLAPLPKSAHETANRVQSDLRNGKDRPLAGVLLAVKDNIALKDVQLSCASHILAGYISPYTATALQRLIDAGVTIVGKTNLDEFAMGSSTEYSAFGPALNPFDTERVPGGSSGGSAVAVAAGMCTSALGSDTGGSVRQPSSFCGLIGLKPTYGRISRYGLVAFGSSLDQIGIFARTADEAARVFEVMAGSDPLDNTSSPIHVPDCSGGLGQPLEGLRVGLPQEYVSDAVQREIRAAVDRAATELRKLGATVEPCSLPHTKYGVPVYYILATAEASSNLARYDGVRYGPRSEAEDVIRASRQDGFGVEVKRRIMLGTYVLSSGYYDAYYLKAQKVRRLIRQDFLNVFQNFDFLLSPVAPTTAFKLGEKSEDPLAMYLGDIFTVSANLAGIPAISVPFGADDKGLPIGVQLMATHFREDLLLRAAARLEEVR